MKINSEVKNLFRTFIIEQRMDEFLDKNQRI